MYTVAYSLEEGPGGPWVLDPQNQKKSWTLILGKGAITVVVEMSGRRDT